MLLGNEVFLHFSLPLYLFYHCIWPWFLCFPRYFRGTIIEVKYQWSNYRKRRKINLRKNFKEWLPKWENWQNSWKYRRSEEWKLFYKWLESSRQNNHYVCWRICKLNVSLRQYSHYGFKYRNEDNHLSYVVIFLISGIWGSTIWKQQCICSIIVPLLPFICFLHCYCYDEFAHRFSSWRYFNNQKKSRNSWIENKNRNNMASRKTTITMSERLFDWKLSKWKSIFIFSQWSTGPYSSYSSTRCFSALLRSFQGNWSIETLTSFLW